MYLVERTAAWKSGGLLPRLPSLLTYSGTSGNLPDHLALTSSISKMREVNLIISKGPLDFQSREPDRFFGPLTQEEPSPTM